MCALCGANQFVEFELDGFSVSVLCVLNQKHHQKGHDGGACIDDQLPSVAEVKQRTCDEPNPNDAHCKRKYK